MSRPRFTTWGAAAIFAAMSMSPPPANSQTILTRIPADFLLGEVFPHSRLLVIAADQPSSAGAERTAVRDAVELRDVLCTSYGFDPAETWTLIGAEARRDTVRAAFSLLQHDCSPMDRLVVVISGNSQSDGNGNILFTPIGVGPREGDATPLQEFIALAESLHIRQTLVLFNLSGIPVDTAAPNPRPTTDSTWFRATIRQQVLAVIGAANVEQQNIVQKGTGRGLFLHHLTQGLRTSGADLNEDGVITWSELVRYVRPRVSIESQGQQSVWCARPVGAPDEELILIPTPLIARLPARTHPDSAEISVDGTLQGLTPATIRFQRYGPHLVRFSRRSFLTDTLRLDPRSLPDSVDIRLIPSVDFVLTTTPEGASTWIDSLFLGQTPLKVPWERKTIRIRFEREFFQPVVEEIDPLRSDRYVIARQLVRKPGVVEVSGAPMPAEVTLDGEDTTVVITAGAAGGHPVPQGPYRLSVVRAGYWSDHRQAIVDSLPVPLAFRLASKSKSISILFSALLPGSGQIFMGRTVLGIILAGSFVAASAVAIGAYTTADQNTAAYHTWSDRYVAAVSLEDIRTAYANLQHAYASREDARKRFTIAATIGGAVWAYNLVDALLFDASAGEISVSLTPTDEGSRLSLHLPF